MPGKSQWQWVVALGVFLVSQWGWLDPGKAESPSVAPFRFGLCEDYPEETRSIQNARSDLEFLRANRISLLRVGLGWDGIEARRGQYDWTFWDQFVAAAQELEIELLPYVCYTPEWAARPGDQPWRRPPRDFLDFRRFMVEAAARYRGRIRSWEIWNEPDNPAYWDGTAVEFAEMLRLGSSAVRQSDPDALVVSGGIAWDCDFLEKVLEQPGVSESVDAINIHNYFETWYSDPIERIDDYVDAVHRILIRIKADKPIWMAEAGYSSFRPGDHLPDAYQATYSYEHTPEFQAASFFRMLVPVIASGKVSTIAWYRINDLSRTEAVIGDDHNRHLGVRTTTLAEKPVLKAVRFFQQLFEEGGVGAHPEVRVTARVGADVETHALTNAHGDLVITAWLRVVSPARPLPNDGQQTDPREERLAIRIPREYSQHASLYDATGNPLMDRLEMDPDHKAAGFSIRGGEVLVFVVRRDER